MESALLSYLGHASLRCLWVAAGGGVMAWRARGAAAKHTIWTAVLVGMLCLIPAEAWLPLIPLRVLPSRAPQIAQAPVPMRFYVPVAGPAAAPTPQSKALPYAAFGVAYIAGAAFFLFRVLAGLFVSLRLRRGQHASLRLPAPECR